jgi:hypothetical protein
MRGNSFTPHQTVLKGKDIGLVFWDPIEQET